MKFIVVFVMLLTFVNNAFAGIDDLPYGIVVGQTTKSEIQQYGTCDRDSCTLKKEIHVNFKNNVVYNMYFGFYLLSDGPKTSYSLHKGWKGLGLTAPQNYHKLIALLQSYGAHDFSLETSGWGSKKFLVDISFSTVKYHFRYCIKFKTDYNIPWPAPRGQSLSEEERQVYEGRILSYLKNQDPIVTFRNVHITKNLEDVY